MALLFSDLLESRAFRNSLTFEKYKINELKEIFYFYMLILNILIDTSPKAALVYSEKTLIYPLFNGLRFSTTDLGNIMASLLHADEYLDEKIVSLPILEIKRFLRGIDTGTNDQLTRALFQKLQIMLKLPSNFGNFKRMSLDFSTDTKYKQHQTANIFYNELRRRSFDSDILQELHKYLENDKG